jgi:galactitol-specific phosphotransferase system IIB component
MGAVLAEGYEADLILVQAHLLSRLGEIPGTPVIPVKSFVDQDELRAVLGPYLTEFLQERR